MNDRQLSLFPVGYEPAAPPTPLTRAEAAGRSRPHAVGSETSKAAADALGEQAGTLCAAVFSYLVGRGERGATDSEIQSGLAIDGNSERPRRRALQNRGLIIDSGQRRKTPSGREATVWIIAPGNRPREHNR
ncbi:MAG: hypothetical protein ACOC46_00615 [Pirellulales bacterium]